MSNGRLLVVTTRSKLRGVRHLPSMLNATLSIREQLAAAEGVVRWASVIAGPTEFWTISAWDSRHHMHEFMRSDAHGRWMWSFSDWLSSFWLMRWRPGDREIGDWDGLRVTAAERVNAGGDGDGLDVPPEVLRSMQEDIPELYWAIGPDGAASFEGTAGTRLARRSVARASGVIVRITVPVFRVPAAVRELRGAQQDLRRDERLVGCAVGVGRRHEAFLLGVWDDRDVATGLLDGGWLSGARRRFGEGVWASEWLPEREFGHWDGRRLRREGRRRAGDRPLDRRDR